MNLMMQALQAVSTLSCPTSTALHTCTHMASYAMRLPSSLLRRSGQASALPPARAEWYACE
jgi:hypothetical protein